MNKIIQTAVVIAKSVLKKETDPNAGCDQLSEFSQRNHSPKELQIFECLACEQCGHEHIGITAENTIPLIIEECEHLICRYS